MLSSSSIRSPLALLALLAGAAWGCVSAGSGKADGGAGGGSTSAGGQGVAGASGAGGTRSGAGGGAGRSTAGAGGATGGSPGGLGGGAAGAVGNPCAARPGLLFCDDFESAAVGSAPPGPRWSTQGVGTDNPIVVDGSTPAHSGSRSVHVSPSAGSFQTFFVFHDAATLPAPGGKFFVRAFMRLSSPMTGGHNTFITADHFATPAAANPVRIGEQVHMLMMTVSGDAHGYLSNQSFYNDGLPGVVFTPAAWTCFEISFDPAATTIDVWVNDAEVPDLHPTNITLDSYDALRFGFEKYAGLDADAGATASLDLWYDDIAIGTQRIGCH
jgi:hypothetical protein